MEMTNDKKYLAACIGFMCLVAKSGGERTQKALDETYNRIAGDYVLASMTDLCIDTMLIISERLDRDFFLNTNEILTRVKSFNLPSYVADRVMRMAMAVVYAEDDPRTEQIDAIGYIAEALNLKIIDYLLGEAIANS